ncbi:polysaccharide biosynthesis tyrosine autokinase [Streptomyces sp. NPDC046821]|uniref:polysaccharide biosynthesis tyrosine autokinase n=1 Tax=Streptomyces sp. NPDC046821 TaxID=3154702 RepID=UPI0033D44B49
MSLAVTSRAIVGKRPRVSLVALAAFWMLTGGGLTQLGLNGAATVVVFLVAVITLPRAMLYRPAGAGAADAADSADSAARRSARLPLPLWLFAGYALVSFIQQRTLDGAQNTLVYLSFVAVMALAAAWASPGSALLLLRWLRGAAVLTAVGYLVTVVVAGPANNEVYASRLFGEGIWIGLVAAVPLAERSRRGWFAPFLLVTADVLSLSRTSAAVCLFLLLGLVVKGRRRGEFRRALLLAGVFATAAYLLVTRYAPLRDRFTQNDQQGFAGVEIGTSGRSWLWSNTWNAIKEAPWLGHGVGTVQATVGHPHNDYLRLWHDFGLLGLCLWLAAMFVLARGAYRRRRATRNGPEWAIHHAALLAVVGLSLNVITSNLLVYLFVMLPVAVVIGTSLGLGPGSDQELRRTHPSSSNPKGYTLDLRGFLKALARRWLSVTALTLLGLGAGIAFTTYSTPQYQADSQIFVSTRTAADISQLNEGSAFSQARVQSYADIISSPAIAKSVIGRLGLTMTPAELTEHISAKVKLNTVLIDISVTDTSPRRAARIANSVASESSRMLVSLETPTGERAAPVSIGITRQAEPRTDPISPKPVLDAAIGLLAGLVVGVGLAVLRETLDTTVRTSSALAEVTGLAMLGSIPFDKEAPQTPLAVGPAGYSARAEAYRLVRTNLQFAQVDRRPRVIMVTSPLPGEGKTNTATNLALSLAETGARICLVDADLRNPCVAKNLGLVQDAGLTSVLIGMATTTDVLQSFGEQGLSVLTSGPMPPNPAELLASDRMRQILEDLTQEFDTVVVDSAPLLPVADTVGLAPAVDGTVLVVRAGRTPGERVKAAVSALHSVNASVLGGVLSMAKAANKGYGYGYGYGYGTPPTGTENLVTPPRKEADTVGISG